MTERDRVMRDIDILRQSIKAEWEKLSESDLTPEARATLRTHIEECMDKLKVFCAKLEDSNA